MIIWHADANGQLGQGEEDEENTNAIQDHEPAEIIGPYTRAARPEKGTENNSMEYAKKQKTIPMTI